VLRKSGQKATLLYYYNSIAMLISYTACRILTIPVLVYMLRSVVGTEQYNAQNLFGRVLPFAAHSVMDVLNIIWFFKIVHIVNKMPKKWTHYNNDNNSNNNDDNNNIHGMNGKK
jgi:hypothetical protein